MGISAREDCRMPADLSKSLVRLESASRKLKANSDRLNAIIFGAEEHLQKIDPGVESWLEHPDHLLAPVVTTQELSSYDVRDGAQPGVRKSFIDGHQVRYRVGYRLGWTRIGRDYRLAVQNVKENHLQELEDLLVPVYDPEVHGDCNPEPLQAAPRLVRLDAIAKLPTLFDAISDKVERYGASLEKALSEIQEGEVFKLARKPSKPVKEDEDDIPF
jgi:hypothetical protein